MSRSLTVSALASVSTMATGISTGRSLQVRLMVNVASWPSSTVSGASMAIGRAGLSTPKVRGQSTGDRIRGTALRRGAETPGGDVEGHQLGARVRRDPVPEAARVDRLVAGLASAANVVHIQKVLHDAVGNVRADLDEDVERRAVHVDSRRRGARPEARRQHRVVRRGDAAAVDPELKRRLVAQRGERPGRILGPGPALGGDAPAAGRARILAGRGGRHPPDIRRAALRDDPVLGAGFELYAARGGIDDVLGSRAQRRRPPPASRPRFRSPTPNES